MKLRNLWSLLCILAIVLPLKAQAPAHESTVDGRWEAKVGQQITRFEFKNANGEITGSVTEGSAQPLEIRNGRLDGFKLTFDTMQSPRANEEPILMTWSGTIVNTGTSISFVRTAANSTETRGALELEAKRIP